jgi:hypothetical protein
MSDARNVPFCAPRGVEAHRASGGGTELPGGRLPTATPCPPGSLIRC